MKKTKGSFLAKNFGRALVLLALGGTQAFGNTFNYTNGDVLICFRPASPGNSDLIVDAGPVSYFTNLAPNTKITITSYTAQQLSVVSANNGANDLAWSAWALFNNTTVPANVQETLFMSNPRADLTTQTDPYYCATASGQAAVISKLNGILAGASNNANASANNTTSAVLISEGYNLNNSAYSYYLGLTAGNPTILNFGKTFQASPDQYTGDTFTTDGVAVRSDFYWLPPAPDFSQPPGIFLGYFELAPDGSMTYTAYPSAPVTAPTIVSYVHTGTTNTLTFTTGSTGTYTLRGTDSAGLSTARTNWPVLGTVTGDGGPHSLSDVSATDNKFYVITAQ